MATEHIVVVGAGQMGAGIAQVALQAGLRVSLVDVNKDGLAKGADRIKAGLKKLVEKGKLDAAKQQAAEGNLATFTSARDAKDVDVAIEASGSIPALHHAIRATRFGGTICMISYYGGDAAGLRLGDEFHVNRQRLVSARVESLPLRDAPAWTLERLVEVALSWLENGRLRTDGIVTPVVPFGESVEAYREIDEHPERSIKLGIRFP